MKKKYLKYALVLFICVTFVIWIIDYNRILTPDEALSLGEEKYLQFLWMVDGAFNDNEEYLVNGHSLSNDNRPFNCTFDKKNKTCLVKDFESLFHKYFVNSLSVEQVYSDKLSFKHYEMQDDDIIFNANSICGSNRMNLKQNITVVEIERRKIKYLITYDNDEDSPNRFREFKKEFVLKYENRKWKVAKAYYHDSCRMDYNIE